MPSTATNAVDIFMTCLRTAVALYNGIYSNIVLVNNNSHSGAFPGSTYVLVMTICITNYIAALLHIREFIVKNQDVYIGKELGLLGLFIWSGVVLYTQDELANKGDRSVYMLIFVYFIINSITLFGNLLLCSLWCRDYISQDTVYAPTKELSKVVPDTAQEGSGV